MNRDLFLAILAMDAYNRGYGESVSGLTAPELNPDGTPKTTIKIGNATIAGDSVGILGPDAQAAGFYAIAYDWNGETVISYRGTNFEIKLGSVDAASACNVANDNWPMRLAA